MKEKINNKALNEETINEEALSKEEELLIQIQEIEVKMEVIETKVPTLPLDKQDELLEEYYKLKDQHKELKQELKSQRKKEGLIWDKVPVWMYIYALVMLILNFPILSSLIWVRFANFLITVFETSLNKIIIDASSFVSNLITFFLVYSLPLLILISSGLLNVYAVRKPESRKVFNYICIAQIILFLITAIWFYFTSLQGALV